MLNKKAANEFGEGEVDPIGKLFVQAQGYSASLSLNEQFANRVLKSLED